MIVLAVVLTAGNLAFAQLSWKCGKTDKDTVTAELDLKGVLTIRGKGNMGYGQYPKWGDRPWTKNTSAIVNVVIMDGVTSIEDWAFYSCGNLKSVTIPPSVTSIGEAAFRDCPNLMSVTISENGLKSIGYQAFNGCKKLSSFTIPRSVTDIGYGVFAHTSLTSVVIPDGVTTVNSELFFECLKLASITIPESVVSIKNSAFYNCIGLKSVTIPQNVTYIGKHAFGGCKNLTSITVLNPTPPEILELYGDDDTFSDQMYGGVNKATCVLYVPKGSPYKLTNLWNKFKNIKYLP